jgi:hypothetical protein
MYMDYFSIGRKKKEKPGQWAGLTNHPSGPIAPNIVWIQETHFQVIFNYWMKSVFSMDGSYSSHKDRMAHIIYLNYPSGPTNSNLLKKEGQSITPAEVAPPIIGGGVDWPPGGRPTSLVSPLPSTSHHGKNYNCGISPPLVIWRFDPRDEVESTWIHGPTSTTIGRRHPLSKAWTPL